MATESGAWQRTTIDLRGHRERCGRRPVSVLGMFFTDLPRDKQRLEDADVPCPYCGGLLKALPAGAAVTRVIALDGDPIGDEQSVFVEPVPSDHRVLSCRACQHHWTRPR